MLSLELCKQLKEAGIDQEILYSSSGHFYDKADRVALVTFPPTFLVNPPEQDYQAIIDELKSQIDGPMSKYTLSLKEFNKLN